jgi:hypothetical protein
MPSISLSPPGAPALLTGLSPIATNPIAAIEGVALPAFDSLIDDLGQDFTFDASLPLKPSVGKTLPPERPNIAGGPGPLPLIDIESVMIGSSGGVPVSSDVSIDPAPVSNEGLAEAPVTADQPAPSVPDAAQDLPAETRPVADGLRNWRLGGASIPVLVHVIARLLPAPVQLPPEDMPDMPAIDPALPSEQGNKDSPAAPQPEPAQAADVPAAPPFAPIAWTTVPSQPIAERAEPAADSPARPQSMPATRTSVEAQFAQNAKPAADGLQPSAPQPMPPATPQPMQVPPPQASIQPAALPHGFNVPPEVGREIAQLVQAATGESDERAARDTTGAAPHPTAASSAPQVAPFQPAPLHPAFAVSNRPVIDTGRAEWMQAMIDRIAEMPQVEGGRRDAQIRLVPDALGPVEVKIEQRQERLHVTLQAETPQARQLLSDAAPKLHELAEARGIRFAQAGFGSADPQERRQAPDQQQPALPLRPRRAADAEADSQIDGDLIA